MPIGQPNPDSPSLGLFPGDPRLYQVDNYNKPIQPVYAFLKLSLDISPGWNSSILLPTTPSVKKMNSQLPESQGVDTCSRTWRVLLHLVISSSLFSGIICFPWWQPSFVTRWRMAQLVRVLDDLPKDQHSVPRTHVGWLTTNYLATQTLGILLPSSGLCEHSAHEVHIQKTHI